MMGDWCSPPQGIIIIVTYPKDSMCLSLEFWILMRVMLCITYLLLKQLAIYTALLLCENIALEPVPVFVI